MHCPTLDVCRVDVHCIQISSLKTNNMGFCAFGYGLHRRHISLCNRQEYRIDVAWNLRMENRLKGCASISRNGSSILDYGRIVNKGVSGHPIHMVEKESPRDVQIPTSVAGIGRIDESAIKWVNPAIAEASAFFGCSLAFKAEKTSVLL